MAKNCPHCGQLLDDAAFKCSRCERWVPNELFRRLCAEDITLIKNSDLTPFTPSLVAAMVIDLLKDSSLNRRLQEVGGGLSGKQEFNLLVFESYCHFNGIGHSAKKKRSCRDTIMHTLRDKLLAGIIESSSERTSRIKHEESMHSLGREGRLLYDRLEDVWKMPSPFEASEHLASMVIGDEQATIDNAVYLFTHLMHTLRSMEEIYAGIFLVEEDDFDWQALVGRYAL